MNNVREAVSPDTTNEQQYSSSLKNSTTPLTKSNSTMAVCDYCPSPSPALGSKEDTMNHLTQSHEAALFACGLCDDKFEAMEDVRGHVSGEHAISTDIVDKLVRLPFTSHLRIYKCVACSSRKYIGITEDKMRAHFKTKHKTNVIKPFLLKRICRVCGHDKSASDTDLVKHINTAHPRSEFCPMEDEDVNNDEAIDHHQEEVETEVKPVSPPPPPPPPVITKEASPDEAPEITRAKNLIREYEEEVAALNKKLEEKNESPKFAPNTFKKTPVEKEASLSPPPPPPPPPAFSIKKPTMPTLTINLLRDAAKKTGEAPAAAASTNKERQSRKRTRSGRTSSSGSSSSSDESPEKTAKGKGRPKQYASSESSVESENRAKANKAGGKRVRAALDRERDRSSPERKVFYEKEDNNRQEVRERDRDRERERRSRTRDSPPPRPNGNNKNSNSYFGVNYVPPSGYCDDCNQGYDSGKHAQAHFKSHRHYNSVRDKFRCYFCNIYIKQTKEHLESRHRDLTFQCWCKGCPKPRFTEARKVLDHIKCNHPNEVRGIRETDEYFRRKLLSLPKSLASYTCRLCNIVFHGDLKIVIVHQVSSNIWPPEKSLQMK